MNIYFIFPCQLSECPPCSEKWPPWDSFERTFFPFDWHLYANHTRWNQPTILPLFFFLLLLSLCLQYGTCINNSWPVIRASSIGDLLMEGRCSPSVPGGMLRVVVSAPICQNAIRQTMEALISTSRPIIFKWLLAEECNQSITDKILLKASLPLCLSLYPSLTPPSFFLTFCLSVFLLLSPFWSNWDTVTTIKERKMKKIKKTNSHHGHRSSSSHYQWWSTKWEQLRSTSVFFSSQGSSCSITSHVDAMWPHMTYCDPYRRTYHAAILKNHRPVLLSWPQRRENIRLSDDVWSVRYNPPAAGCCVLK